MKLKHTLLASGAFGGMTANEQRLGRFLRDGTGHPAAAPTPTPAPEPAPTPAPEPTGQDAFDVAFAENAAEPAAPAAGPEPASAPAAEPAPAEPAAPAPVETPALAPAAGESAAPAAPAEAPAPTPEPKPSLTPEQVLEQLAGLVAKPAAPAATPAPAAAPVVEGPRYTEEEQGLLTDYEKNWPDVARAETIKRRVEYQDLLGFIFTEMTKHTAPLFEQQATIGNTLHMTELKGLVPDYTESLETQVAGWVDTQPSYLQTAYKQVMQNGTSEEIADLIGRYRSATGNAAPAPAAPAPAVPAAAPAATSKPAAKTELSSAAKQAAESLAPVSGDRSAVPQGEDTQDFDSAFAKYAADMK